MARKALKFSAATAVTTLYGAVIYQVTIKKVEREPVDRNKVAATAGALIAVTWLATLL